MAAMGEGKLDVVVQVKREQGKKDDPPNMPTDLPASMTFQQLLERIVPNTRGRGVLPYMGNLGMCGPKRYGFSAFLVIIKIGYRFKPILAILVINGVWF